MNNTGKAAAVTASLSSLPDDQRQQVLSYLTCPELLTLTMVSKAVRVIALRSHSLVFDNSGTTNNNNDRTTTRHTNPNLRRAIGNKINLEPFSTHPRHQQQNQRQRWIDGSNGMNEAATISETHLDNLLQRFHSLRKLRLNGITPPVHDEQRLIQIINSCQAASSIVHIELHNVRLVQNKYKLILPNNQNLQHFAISGTIFSFYNPVLKSFVSSSKNLQCLHLNGCRSLVDADVQDMSRTILHSPKSKLKELSLKSSSKLIRPGIHCPSLEILDLSLSPMIQDLTNVICPRLKKIDLSYCTKVTDDSVHSLLLSCPCLEVLNLDGCSTLSAADFTSRSLKRLDMNLCTDLNSVNINCEELKKLELGFCNQLKNLRLYVKKLKSLDLSMLGSLTDLFISGPSLLDLNLSGCFTISSDSVFFTCPNLRSIDISSSGLVSCQNFEKEYLAQSSPKIHVLKGGSAHDWMV